MMAKDELNYPTLSSSHPLRLRFFYWRVFSVSLDTSAGVQYVSNLAKSNFLMTFFFFLIQKVPQI